LNKQNVFGRSRLRLMLRYALVMGGLVIVLLFAMHKTMEWAITSEQARELLDAGQPDGLLTGYYEPLLTGSRMQERPNQVPLRAIPTDLLTIDLSAIQPQLKGLRLRGRLDGQRVVPYADRREIETRETKRGYASQPVIAWLDDPVDAFFLEIQGSGRVQLRDGSLIRVGYADQNGHPYQAIGRTLVQQGALKREEVTAPAIQQWLREHPAQARQVMQTNPGVVFFRELATDPALRAEIQDAVNDTNKMVSHAEAIKKFHILDRDLTEEADELTPTMKVKRNVVARRYAKEIEHLYQR